MRAFIYAAALHCEACGRAIRETLAESAPADPDNESSYDSDEFPKGPYADGGGEADSPQHCDSCGVFLENPLTPDGVAYTRDLIADAVRSGRMDRHNRTGAPLAAAEWQAFYAADLLAA